MYQQRIVSIICWILLICCTNGLYSGGYSLKLVNSISFHQLGLASFWSQSNHDKQGKHVLVCHHSSRNGEIMHEEHGEEEEDEDDEEEDELNFLYQEFHRLESLGAKGSGLTFEVFLNSDENQDILADEFLQERDLKRIWNRIVGDLEKSCDLQQFLLLSDAIDEAV